MSNDDSYNSGFGFASGIISRLISFAFCLNAMSLAYCYHTGNERVMWMLLACCCWPCYLIGKVVRGEAICKAGTFVYP